MMPGETGDYYQRRQLAAESLNKLQAQYRLAEQRRDELRRQLQGEEPTFGIFTGGTPAKSGGVIVDPKVAEYQRQLDQLLLEYTDKHPRVIALRETIAALRAQKGGDAPIAAPTIEADPAKLAARALDINPVYQSMKISLSQAELELVDLRNKIAQQQSAVSDLQSKVNTIPEVEAELARLNRGYEVNRAQYQALLQRLESARLSEQAEDSREQVKFRVIEPPAIPLTPLAPNRPLLATGVLILALGLGGASAFMRSQLKPVFSDRRAFATITGIPVHGVVAMTQSLSAKLSGHSYRWTAMLIALAASYLVVVASAAKLAAMMAGGSGDV